MDAALSGIRAALQMADVSAQNIANLRSAGYRAYRLRQSAAPDFGGVRASVERTDAEPDLAVELVGLIEARSQLAANVHVLRRENEMLGTLLDVFA